MNCWLTLFLLSPCFTPGTWTAPPEGTAQQVTVQIVEGIPDKRSWDFERPAATSNYAWPAFGFVAVPKKWSDRAVMVDRSNPFLVVATGTVRLRAGEYRLLLRSRNAARLSMDGRLLAETDFIKGNASGHESVPDAPKAVDDQVRLLPVGHQEELVTIQFDGAEHELCLEAFVGGQKLRMELGELCVAVARPGEPFRLLGSAHEIPLSDAGWTNYLTACRQRLGELDAANRQTADVEESKYWAWRHDLARQVWRDRPGPQLPPVNAAIPLHNAIDQFIGSRLERQGDTPAPIVDDLSFLRRITLDTVGVIPTRPEIEAFLGDSPGDRRTRAIERLLNDPRWADHWVGYWQDVLAENPGILKPTLNNTGPFRWWIQQAFSQNMAMDRFATELVRMEGSPMYGGPGGFSLATLNDVPMASKAHIAAKAFLGIELQCARCHDAPFHPYKQKELFGLAAMLARSPQKVPLTSTVPPSERTRRPLVQITLEPGTAVEANWPFPDLAPRDLPDGMLRDPDDSRERFAAICTGPENLRFAQVLVNRLWKRYLGLGLVEPVDDWNDATPSHPELLDFLARELITHDYDLKHVARLILNSHTYQRAVGSVEPGQRDADQQRSFAWGMRRRMSAEQLVDSMFLAVGKEFRSEELNLDVDGRRPITEFLNLGTPQRAWEFTSLSNERDRPALSLPIAQSIVDVLTTFGWRESRQNPITEREEQPTPLQPLVLANGTAGHRVTRLSDDSSITTLCLEDRPIAELVSSVMLQVLSRPPTPQELEMFANLLGEGYGDRKVSEPTDRGARQQVRSRAVSWSNHLHPDATRLKLEAERIAREGDPPTARLTSDWRERMEDMLWALMNSPEFVFVP